MRPSALARRRAWLGGASALIAIGCGESRSDVTTVRSEIQSGTDVSAANNPGAVQLFHGAIRPCSGTLLHDRWVLTAAHCDTGLPMSVTPPSVVTPADPSNPGNPPASGAVPVVEVDKFANVDLMLLRLSQPLSLAPRGPVGLWNGDNADLGPATSLTTYGFGISTKCLADVSDGSGYLRTATFPSPGNPGPIIQHTHDSLFWMQEGPTTFSCHGDSGGPLFATADRLGRPLWGVAATTLHPANNGVHTAGKGNLNQFRAFIRSTISSPGNVTGPSSNRSDIFLAGASSWSTFYGASVDGGGTISSQTATGTALFGIGGFINATHEANARLFMGDFDGDGLADLGVVGGTSGFIRARSTGTLWQFSGAAISGASTFNSLARVAGARPLAGDFDADGRTDVALLGGTSWTTVPIEWPRTGTFQFTNVSDSTLATAARQAHAQVVAGDFDGDGRDDIAVAGGSQTSLTVGFSNGDGSFKTVIISPTDIDGLTFCSAAAASLAKLVAGDFNGDGRDDLAVVGSLAVDFKLPMAFAVNGGTFLFPKPRFIGDFATFAQQDSSVRAVAGDFDGDGRADIALAGPPWWTSVPIAYSNGDTTFRVTNDNVSTFPGLAATSGVTLLAMRGGGLKKPAHEATKVAAARDTDGRLRAFYIGTDGALYTNVEVMRDGAGELWSGENPMGGYAKEIAVGRDFTGAMYLFYIGSNDVLHFNRQDDPFGEFTGQVVLGPTAKQMAVGSQNDLHLDLFFIGRDDSANYHLRQNGSTFTGPLALGGWSKQIVTARDLDGRQNIFTIGTNDHIYFNRETSANSGAWVGESAFPPIVPGAHDAGVVQNIGTALGPDNTFYLVYMDAGGGYGEFNQLPGQNWYGPGAIFQGPPLNIRPFSFGRTASSLIVFFGTYYMTATNGVFSGFGQTNANPSESFQPTIPSLAVSKTIPHELVYIENRSLYHSRQDSGGAWLSERRLDPRPQL